LEKKITNNELNEKEMEVYYAENKKIGLPLILDRGSDII